MTCLTWRFYWVTLTFDLWLDHWTRSRYYQGQPLYQISWPYVKRFSSESANRQTHRHIHTHTDGSVFITSTADAGGNEMGICIFHIYRLHPDSLSNIIWNNVINLFNITIWDIPFFLITSGLPVWRLSAIWFHAVRRISHYHTTEIICVLLFFHM